ncbi:T-cell immunomodulatory protein-like protein [Leptotrombidium deliense]|uniref:T-cell immunomodulatory protein-like protein n=1 Tax=Leptotrombidium deliense TaxID=299467 RepID=A0A443S3V4_9ACAR|nr:T-cell immunomodulatory protein-like protein [Leptotrombidium deliense]
MNLIFYVFVVFGCIAKSDEITHKEIRFPSLYGLIAAFGDFNSDKLTDIFVIGNGGQDFQILRQFEPGNKPELRAVKDWHCKSFAGEKIVSLIPSDFDGDAILDVVVVTENYKERPNVLTLRLLRGSRNASSIQCDSLKEKAFAIVKNQPLVLDINSDMISDLLAKEANGKWYVWLGSMDGNFTPVSFPLSTGNKNVKQQIKVELKKHNSNAFIDLNGDFVADIFIDGKGTFEYWLADPDGYTQPIRIETPKEFGSSSFCDINGDGKIDHLVPSCKDSRCSILALKNYTKSDWEVINDGITIGDVEYKFWGNDKLPITLRVGDINSDGFPDLVTLMSSAVGNVVSIVVFINVKSKGNSFGRSFKPVLYANQSLSSDPKIVAFFDLFEDGKLDLIYSEEVPVNIANDTTIKTKDGKQLRITFLLNEETNDSNFLKVLVTSGLCLERHSCYEENIFQKGYRVPYGTNKAGPMICYQLIDANGNEMKSCAGQLSQSSDFALQLPYSLFGLGPDANYVDHVVVSFPTGNTSNIFKRDEEQIVPDSQIVVIPHPVDKPSQWIIQLFVTPSDIIYKTLYTFLGICGALVVIIGILHRKEQLKDLAEQEQYRSAWPDRRR